MKQKHGALEKLYTLIGPIIGTILVVGGLGLFTYVGFFYEAPMVEAQLHEMETIEGREVSMPWPSNGAAAIGAAGYGILHTSNTSEDPIPIASISKLFVALAIMKERPFEVGQDGEAITMTQVDEDYYNDYVGRGGSAYPVNIGETYTQYQAMQALLIPSANNIADTMAVWAFGSLDNYLEYANQMVLGMGLENTMLADASGFSAESVSTPAELILAAEAALQDPVIASIVSQQEANIFPGVEAVFNTNQLLFEPGVIGVKTGTTDEAGANLIFAAEHALTENSSATIIGVVMGQPDRPELYEAARSLLHMAYQNFDFIQVVEEDAVVGAYQIPWSEDVPIVSSGGAIVPAWVGADLNPVAEADAQEPGNIPGEQVGIIRIEHGADTTVVPLVTQGAIPEPSFWWKLQNFFTRTH